MRRFYKDDLIGPYRVIRLFGKGGMGSVYEVEHQKLGVRYALKTFTLEHGSVILLRKRFLAEGKVLARLRHPNLVRVYDLDYDISTGTPYFTMDEILNSEGKPQTLGEMNPGCVSEETLVKWFRQLASALDYIHEKGIVHRDIKPSNILIDGNGSVMLTDFGVARYIDDELRKSLSVTTRFARSKITNDTMKMVIGTRQFMSPEVKSGEAASVTSDDYSLGMVFFWLLTGVWYRGEESQLEILKNFDYDWWTVLPWLMNRQPGMRPPTIAEAASLLKLKTAIETTKDTEEAPYENLTNDENTPKDNFNNSSDEEELSPENNIVEKRKNKKWDEFVWWGFGVLCGWLFCGVGFVVCGFHNGDEKVFSIFVGVGFLLGLRKILKRWPRDRDLPQESGPLDEPEDIPTVKLLACPFCHATMEVDENATEGQHVRCPYCEGKSQYDSKTDTLVDIVEAMSFEPLIIRAKKPKKSQKRQAQNIQPLAGVPKSESVESPVGEAEVPDFPEARKVQRIDPLPEIAAPLKRKSDANQTIKARRVVAQMSQYVESTEDKGKGQQSENHFHRDDLPSAGPAAQCQRIPSIPEVKKQRQTADDDWPPEIVLLRRHWEQEELEAFQKQVERRRRAIEKFGARRKSVPDESRARLRFKFAFTSTIVFLAIFVVTEGIAGKSWTSCVCGIASGVLMLLTVFFDACITDSKSRQDSLETNDAEGNPSTYESVKSSGDRI